jgi:Sulfate permease family
MEKDLELSEFNKSAQNCLNEAEMKNQTKFRDQMFKFIRKRFFVINWLQQYNKNKTNAIGDLIAGITIGLTMIPQSLAYANLANVNSVYGLYSSFIGSIVYMLLGTVKVQNSFSKYYFSK